MITMRSVIDTTVRQQLLRPGNKGATTYANYKQSLVLAELFKSSTSLNDSLNSICNAFKKSTGCLNKGFTFAPRNIKMQFPHDVAVAPSNKSEKVLGEASKLSKTQKEAVMTNVALMNNLTAPQSTQDFVSAVMVQLINNATIYKVDGTEKKKFKISSFPDPMAYTRSIFGNRSPDLPFLSRSNTTSPHCITFMIDIKPYKDGAGEFSDEQIGHIIDMAHELLATEQTGRRGIICGLTDGTRFQFFRVMRLAAAVDFPSYGFQVEASRTFSGDMEGWQVLIALMALPLDDIFLMHEEHLVAGLQLYNILGHGARSAVYQVRNDAEGAGKGSSTVPTLEKGGGGGVNKVEDEGVDNEVPLLPDRSYCKVFSKSNVGDKVRGEDWRGFDAETAALRKLKDVSNIPKVVCKTLTIASAASSQGMGQTERVLVLHPVGLPLWPALSAVRVGARHFAQLVTTVETMHSAGVLHRDIKPANVFLQEDTDLLLLADFDAAVVLEEADPATPTPQMTVHTATRSSKENTATVPLASSKWKLNQQFVWEGTEGYSGDPRPIGPASHGLHVPTPQHDLLALVRTVYSLYTQEGPCYDGDGDYCKDFWASCMPASSMWWDFLQMAQNRDYEALRMALGRL